MNFLKKLKRNYLEAFSFIKESRHYIYSIIAVFFITALFAFFLPTPEILRQALAKFINELVSKTEGLSALGLISFIFLNNLQSSFFGLVLGAFLGVFPVIVALINGYLLGFVASVAVKEGSVLVLWRLLPHGILELTAVFISLGMGMKFGTFMFKNDKKKYFREYLLDSLRAFVLVIIPLLLVAAIIEGSLIVLIP